MQGVQPVYDSTEKRVGCTRIWFHDYNEMVGEFGRAGIGKRQEGGMQ
jgi:hypothetical protein